MTLIITHAEHFIYLHQKDHTHRHCFIQRGFLIVVLANLIPYIVYNLL